MSRRVKLLMPLPGLYEAVNDVERYPVCLDEDESLTDILPYVHKGTMILVTGVRSKYVHAIGSCWDGDQVDDPETTYVVCLIGDEHCEVSVAELRESMKARVTL
jgi:hypothetical protein